jgi:hypothetical protein
MRLMMIAKVVLLLPSHYEALHEGNSAGSCWTGRTSTKLLIFAEYHISCTHYLLALLLHRSHTTIADPNYLRVIFNRQHAQHHVSEELATMKLVYRPTCDKLPATNRSGHRCCYQTQQAKAASRQIQPQTKATNEAGHLQPLQQQHQQHQTLGDVRF